MRTTITCFVQQLSSSYASAPFAKPTKAGCVFADDLDDDSYNLTLPLLIGTHVTPYTNITSGHRHLFRTYLTPTRYFTDHPLCPICVIDFGNCTVRVANCKLDQFHADCLDRLDA
ncbi:hypothetical protein LOD99_1471 [Oopsacas minuta]|uniref:RING-type domain-containing protein n=1 Tax=Oopsacas minuta TaxID=111878 RepID=A0AAV7K616_9METZ|nr:hypothetical protein LOD99_1471 [Oopsacas minuta]